MKLLLSLIVLAACVPAVFALNKTLDSGECYSTRMLNNESLVVCAENFTARELFNVTVSVVPGETKVVNRSGNVITAVCGSSAQSTDRCSLDRDIDPGERLRIDDGACDIDVKCDEPDTGNDEGVCVDSVEQTINGTVSMDGESVEISVGGKRRMWTLYDEPVTTDFEMKIQCPVEISEDLVEGITPVGWAKIAVVYDFVPLLLNRTIYSFDYWTMKMQLCNDKVSALEGEKGSLIQQTSTQEVLCTQKTSELQAKINITSSDVARLTVENEGLSEENSNWRAGTIAGWFIVIVLATILVILSIYVMRRGDDQ